MVRPAARSNQAFIEALDYVGLDFFPDVFRPVPAEQLRAAVEGVLTHFRRVNLAAGGIPAEIPIRVTENGWPTGPVRPPERQAAVLRRWSGASTTCGLLSTSRTTSSSCCETVTPNGRRFGYQFGLLRHDYTPKPAFETYVRLIAELGAKAWDISL